MVLECGRVLLEKRRFRENDGQRQIKRDENQMESILPSKTCHTFACKS